MSYRNITVNGTVYKFVIGKKFTKVVGLASVLNSDLGAEVGYEQYLVTPADVRRMILGNGVVDSHFHDGPHTCVCGKTSDDVKLGAWPFEYEIYGKHHYDYMCDECEERNADDI